MGDYDEHHSWMRNMDDAGHAEEAVVTNPDPGAEDTAGGEEDQKSVKSESEIKEELKEEMKHERT